MSISEPTAIAMTTVFGYVFDDDGVTPIENASVRFLSKSFMIDDNLIRINETVLSDVDGLYQASLPQTSPIGAIVNVEISWTDSDGGVHGRKETIAVGTSSPVSVQESRVVTVGSAVVGASGGDVVGPVGATNNALARFDLGTGKLIKNTGAILDNSNNLSGIGDIALSGTVDGRNVSADGTAIDLNTAKDTNATHTGEITGETALTLDKTAISNKDVVTVDDADYILIEDSSDDSNLKKVLASDFGGGGGGTAVEIAYLKDVQASGVDGGDFTQNAWQTRVLGVTSGDTGIVSLSTNQFTLQAGTYHIEASAPAYGVNQHKCKLRNITDSTDDIIGSSEQPSSGGISTCSFLSGAIVLAGEKIFELQHRCLSTRNGNGFGKKSTFGVDEVYSQVKITKLS